MSAANSQRIIEGRCPSCDRPLERRERDGWCKTCGVGWAYKTTGPRTAIVSLTIEPDLLVEMNTSLGRFTASSARITRQVDVVVGCESDST